MALHQQIPLGLYVHIPWCLKKCPYCDFNSHVDDALPWQGYIEALLADVEKDYTQCDERVVSTVFFGGGTPSLMPGKFFQQLVAGIKQRIDLDDAAEITLEANPGSVDAENFQAYFESGVNRLSIGAQSFRNQQLKDLGRIHRVDAIMQTYLIARSVGFENINLDLMHSLPNDSVGGSVSDLKQAINLKPKHISWYELTLEEGTQFAIKPPPRPSHEDIISNHELGMRVLSDAEYLPYEVSAFAQNGYQCRHNNNYWQFGDYLGLGAGAHGKITHKGEIHRTAKRRNPTSYLKGVSNDEHVESQRQLERDDLICEFILNASRLSAGFTRQLFEQRTGLNWAVLEKPLRLGTEKGFLTSDDKRVQLTPMGQRFLNDVQLLFC